MPFKLDCVPGCLLRSDTDPEVPVDAARLLSLALAPSPGTGSQWVTGV